MTSHFRLTITTDRLLFHMLRAIAQFETEIRAERQMEGILKAQQCGVKFGRHKTLSPAQIADLQQCRQQGVLIKTLMTDYSLSKFSVYRYLGFLFEIRSFEAIDK